MWTSFIGFMACGKTSLTAALGRSSGLPTADLDLLIEENAGMSVPQLFEAGGVELFRRHELETLQRIAPEGELLLATGGGVVESPFNRDLLRRRGRIVWLDAPWEVVRERMEIAGIARRPMISHLGWQGMQALYCRRSVLYAGAADYRLDSARPLRDVVRAAQPLCCIDGRRK